MVFCSVAITSLHLAERPCSLYHLLGGSQGAPQAMERILEITRGPVEKQSPLNILQHSLNGFQPCESFICEAPKEIASSCHCKRGNLRHAQCNYSHWELPKTTGWHPIAGGGEGRGEGGEAVEYLLLCVARTLMSCLPTASQVLPVPQGSTTRAGGEPHQGATSSLAVSCGSRDLCSGRNRCLGLRPPANSLEGQNFIYNMLSANHLGPRRHLGIEFSI